MASMERYQPLKFLRQIAEYRQLYNVTLAKIA